MGGTDLIKLQKKLIRLIKKIFKEDYSSALKELEKNIEVRYNDLHIDQQQFIEKSFADEMDSLVAIIASALNIGIKKLNKLMSKEVTVETSFGLQSEDVLNYAREFCAEKITKIDEYTRKRINNLISQGIKDGWGYKKIAEELKKDYGFSEYRAVLIASNEIGTAYIQGKNMQFDRYRTEFGQVGRKRWISHRDDRTTGECLANDEQGRIPFDQPFQSGSFSPPRFPGCRCDEEYALFKPN